jgi:hypothetical protein
MLQTEVAGKKRNISDAKKIKILSLMVFKISEQKTVYSAGTVTL